MISSQQKTNIGLRRTSNEDFYGSIETNIGTFYIVCDGMGGHSSGEIASKLATETIIDFIKTTKIQNVSEVLDEAIGKANEVVYSESISNLDLNGMGTTLVMVCVKDDKLYFASVGDSRIYLSRGNSFKQLTEDHSFVQQLLKAGIITLSESKSHPRRNEITKAIGLAAEIEPFIEKTPLKLKNKDKILLCSDGLTSMISDDKIVQIISKKEISLETKVNNLISEANKSGGYDNITVTLLEIENKKLLKFKIFIGLISFITSLLIAFLFINEPSKKSDKQQNISLQTKKNEVKKKPEIYIEKKSIKVVKIKKQSIKNITYNLSCMSDNSDAGSVDIINLLSKTRDNAVNKTINKISENDEMEIGLKSFIELKETNDIKSNYKLNFILQKLAVNLFKSKYRYKIYEIVDPTLNAFTIGAYIYVNSGMMSFVKSDDELAAIIAHEINHNELGHLNKKMSIKRTNDELFGEFFSSIAMNIDDVLGASFNQKDETLCDLYGIDLMILSGFKPCSSVDLWNRMAQEEAKFNGLENLMRSHPYSSKRAGCSANHLLQNYEFRCE